FARVRETKGDYHTAIALLTEALNTNPKDVACLSIRAHIAERQQQGGEAAMWHRRILEVNPSLSTSNLFLAQQHYAQGAYREALSYFERLLRKERNNRIYKLYWLLATVHTSGVLGLEEQLSEAGQWRDLIGEEQRLVQDLLLTASQDVLDKHPARA